MSLRVSPLQLKRFQAALALEASQLKKRKEAPGSQSSDIVTWGESHYYSPMTEKLVLIPPFQKCVLRCALTRNERGRFPYQTYVYSTIKQSGKSASSGLVSRWMAETQVKYGEIFTIGNDLDQAKGRGFREAGYSIKLTPGYNPASDVLPGRWRLQKTSMECLTSGTTIKSIAVDAKGEAGGKPALSVWTELWGFEYEDALRFWDEMTPVPTVPDSIRWVETYVGYDGESTLLKSLFDAAMEGRQLTAGEAAHMAARDVPGESYEELLWAFHECNGNPDALIPIWVNEAAGIYLYWDSGFNARRMPWQHLWEHNEDEADLRHLSPEQCTLCTAPEANHHVGVSPDVYYPAQESSLPPNAFQRFHHNVWVGAESQFIPIETWDGLRENLPSLQPGDRTPAVLGVDAATTGDCFAVVMVTRHPERHDDVAVRRLKLWTPQQDGGRVSYADADNFIRLLCQGGCRFGHAKSKPVEDCQPCKDRSYEIPPYNVVCLVYDPYQLEALAQSWRKDSVVWAEDFPQMGKRLQADRGLYDSIINRHLAHDGNEILRQHVLNANAKVQKDEDSKLRIVKKAGGRKIDAVVALSMANFQCKYLMI